MRIAEHCYVPNSTLGTDAHMAFRATTFVTSSIQPLCLARTIRPRPSGFSKRTRLTSTAITAHSTSCLRLGTVRLPGTHQSANRIESPKLLQVCHQFKLL